MGSMAQQNAPSPTHSKRLEMNFMTSKHRRDFGVAKQGQHVATRAQFPYTKLTLF